MPMNRYWITVRQPARYPHAGVTAISEADAAAILKREFGASVEPESIAVIRDMRELDALEIFNITGNSFQRGMWYPRGPLDWGRSEAEILEGRTILGTIDLDGWRGLVARVRGWLT
ncbi:MAG: hypothetical protein KY446_10295 [Proteobacteria bacterium]|nr:hypothetical protein [Pseudomonadota bacterium]